MTSFKKTLIPSYPKIGAGVTPDTLYWRKLGFPFIQKEFGAITSIDFCQIEPYYFAACSSTKVQIFNSLNNQIYRTLSRFKTSTYGGKFRQDGKLLVAGDEEGALRLFDVSSKTLLRMFKDHTNAVHNCSFLKDDVHVASFSDDKTVGVWDIPAEKRIHTYNEHQDYIRAGAVSLTNQDILFSGSYDHSIKMYDVRVPTSVWTVDHGSPVEALLVLPSSGIIISAGGVDIKVWDAVAGGLVAKVTQHHKTVTSLCLASEGRKFMSGSLDCHVKIFDTTTYQPVHTLTYVSPILSIGIAPDDSAVAVGMADGSLSIQQRKKPKSTDTNNKNVEITKKKKVSYKYSLEAQGFQSTENDVKVINEKREVLKKYDHHLKKFNSTLALDSVLESYKKDKKCDLVVAVLKELIIRGSIRNAIAGKTPRSLYVLLRFLIDTINDVRYNRIVVDVTNIVLDLYTSEMLDSIKIRKLLRILRNKVNREVNYIKALMTLKGTMEILLAAGSAGSDTSTEKSNMSFTESGESKASCDYHEDEMEIN